MALTSTAESTSYFQGKLGLDAGLAVLESAWAREVGALGGLARVTAIDRSTLVVEVTSSSALQDLRLRRRELVRRINAHFPSPRIDDIAVKMTAPRLYGNGR